jgi:hypothetical protein
MSRSDDSNVYPFTPKASWRRRHVSLDDVVTLVASVTSTPLKSKTDFRRAIFCLELANHLTLILIDRVQGEALRSALLIQSEAIERQMAVLRREVAELSCPE